MNIAYNIQPQICGIPKIQLWHLMRAYRMGRCFVERSYQCYSYALHCTVLYCTDKKKYVTQWFLIKSASASNGNTFWQPHKIATYTQQHQLLVVFCYKKTRFIWHISTIKKVSASVKHAYNQTRTRLSNVIFLFVLSFRYIFLLFFIRYFYWFSPLSSSIVLIPSIMKCVSIDNSKRNFSHSICLCIHVGTINAQFWILCFQL